MAWRVTQDSTKQQDMEYVDHMHKTLDWFYQQNQPES